MAVRFQDNTDRITYSAEPPPNPADGLTVTAWVYLSVDTDINATVARLWSASGATTVGTFATTADGTSGPGYFTSSGSVTSTLGLAVGQWRKVAFSRFGTSVTVYAASADGSTEVDTGDVGGGTPAGITLGGRSPSDGAEALNGRLAYVRVWSMVLTQAQIEAEWESTAPTVTAGLWADWPLGTAEDLTDHSGNGRHLEPGPTAVATEDDPPVAASLPLLVGDVRASTGGGRPTLTQRVGIAVLDARSNTRAGQPAIDVAATQLFVDAARAVTRAGRAVLGQRTVLQVRGARAATRARLSIAPDVPPERTCVVPAESRTLTVTR